MAVILLVKVPDGETTELPLFGKITLGRSSSCDFKVNDSKISGKHCSIELTKKGEILVKDLGSTNGTYLNNSKINHSVFRLNDTILMGGTVIVIDERRLSTLEKKAIGINIIKNRSELKELPSAPELPNKKETQSMDSDSAEKTNLPQLEGDATRMKKKITLKKELKEKRSRVNFISTDAVIDQEESSGNTKLLKLDNVKKGKSKG